MKVLIFLMLLFNLTGKNLFSQQCAYDNYYLFALHVHTPYSTVKVPNLKMYLVDEQDRAVRASVTFWEEEQWQYRSDTLFFWEHTLMEKGGGTSPLFRQKYFNLGDYYVVAFHLDKSVLKEPETYPIYKVKIEAALNGWPNEAAIIHLPIQKAVRICGNGITSDFPLVKPVETLDEKNFIPIDIALNQRNEAMVVEQPKDELKYTVRFDYQTLPDIDEGQNTYLLNGARIYNTQTGQLHQEIYIPCISKSIWKESKNMVKFVDFYNRGIKEAIDFSVLIESWRDLEIKCSKHKLNYYIFNSTTKKYELDTTLSNYNDVFYYEPLKTMRRYDFEATKKSRIAYTYELQNNKWVLIDQTETLFELPPPKINYPSSDCIVVNEKSHLLPLKAVIGTQAKLLVNDTFWLYNACQDTLYIKKIESSTRDFFSINQTLLPRQATPLIFNGNLTNSSYDFHINRFFCSLTLTDGSIVGMGIMIPVVSNHAKVYYRTDSTIHYAVANPTHARNTTVVFTYPSGQIKVKGTVLDKDTTLKVGNWIYFKEGTIESDEKVYSKAISLSAFDDNSSVQHTKFNVKVLENGVWKQPIMDNDNNQLTFYLTPKTDNIVAYTDSTSFAFAVQYKKLPVYTTKQFYLLKPHERTLKIGYYEMPFKVYEHQYAIILTHNHIQSRKKTANQLTDSIIVALQKRYPKIETVWISTDQKGFSLQHLQDNERKKVLQQLVRDSSIAFICQLFSVGRKQTMSYCDNRVYANIDIGDENSFRMKALLLGFSKIEIDMGGNRYWLTYNSKLLDKGFFQAFDRLTKEKLVFGAFFNTYFKPVLEDK